MTNLDWVGDGGIFTNLDDFLAWDQNFYHNKLGEGGQDLIALVENAASKVILWRKELGAAE